MTARIRAACAYALDAHRTAAGIEGDDSIQVWHLMLSLLDFCEVKGINADEIIADCRRHQEEFRKESTP